MKNWMREVQYMSIYWFRWQGALRDENDIEFRCEGSQAKRIFAFHEEPHAWL